MIRFSAALVAVAIGVLIGGIAAGELSLVYIAIVLSAVALVALGIGVVLKRDELFGEGQGLALAQAGAGPALPARAGDSYDHQRSNGQMTPPPVQGAAVVGPGAAFAGPGQAGSPSSGAALPPGPARSGGAWGTQTERGSWASPAAAAPVPANSVPPNSAPANRQAPAASGAEAAAGWDAPAGTSPGAGSGSAPPGWFNPREKAADAGAPPPASAPVPGAGGGWSWLTGETTADQPAGKAEAVVPDAAPESDSPVPAGTVLEPATAPAAGPVAADPAATGDQADDAGPGDESLADADATEGDQPALYLVRDARAPEDGGEPGSEPPAATAGDEPGLVTVVRGVPRFHQADCVLIRFMPEDDVQKMPVAQARETGCTPCAACQPEE